MNRILELLCNVRVHHVPEEKRHYDSHGWWGLCTRCGALRFSKARAAR